MKELFYTKLTCNIIYALVLVLSYFDTVYNYWYVRHMLFLYALYFLCYLLFHNHLKRSHCSIRSTMNT